MTDATDDTVTGPFQRAARLYRSAGWLGTLPVGRGPGQKSPPPGGWTGHGAPYPSDSDVGAWETGAEAGFNIGLRMPPGVVGLDIDAGYTKIERGKEVVKRGEETLAALEARFGPLPPTWVSSARPAPSGIRWFRVPELLDGRPINWPGEAAKFIEIIQPGHRYAVVWPSTNPDAGGARYLWDHPQGHMPATVPRPEDLAELPEAWVRGLALTYDRTEKSNLANSQLATWWEQLRSGGPCPLIHSVCTKAVDDLADADGARHEAARDALSAIVRAGGEGHRGAAAAVAMLADAFRRAVGDQRFESGEWQRMLTGAVELAATDNRSPRQNCSHDAPPPATAATVPEGFTVPGVAPLMITPGAPTLSDDRSQATVDAFIAEVEALAGDQRDERVRHIAASLPAAGISEVEQQRARATLTAQSGLSGVLRGEWDAITRDARRQAKEQAKAAAAAQALSAARAEIAARREEGKLLPPPHAPIDVARELAAALPAPAKWWRGDFYLWTGTHYAEWRPEAVDNWLYGRTADAFFEGSAEDAGPKPWRPTENKITGVSHALSRGVLYRPSELDADDSPSQVACANGVYDVATGSLLPHTPERFNLASVPFAYDPQATAPTWQRYLDDVLPADAQALLQEWFGYVVSGRTDQEKILHMQGMPRSGKGTAAHVLENLVGPEAVASPSMPGLVGTFGEQPLIGKTLAVLSDINWKFRDIAEAVEIVKKISGRDSRDVNRKNRDVWHGRLGVRFMIMGNDLPSFTDASGALAHRMMHVQFPGTVMGREDPSLKDDLLKELPGILNWALAGLVRLTAVGHFTAPASAEDLAAEVRRQQSPIQGFLDDTCARTAPEAAKPVPLDELFPVYRAWARSADVEHPLDRERFSRALRSAGLRVERKMINGVLARRVYGLTPASLTAWTVTLGALIVPPVPPGGA